jgi:hypothetical protein
MPLVLALVAALVLTFAGQTPPTPPAPQGTDAPSLVQRYLKRSVKTPASYRATRRLEGANPRFKKTGWIEAVTELVDNKFTFTITARGGSEMVQNRALIPVLEAERDLSKEGDSYEISEANYKFLESAPDDAGHPRIKLDPRRKDKRLLDGFLVLTPDGDVIEINGKLSKSPSFWTPNVHVTRRYGHIDGVRVPLSITSVADVRLAGRSTFSMTYTFQMIDGAPVSKTGF